MLLSLPAFLERESYLTEVDSPDSESEKDFEVVPKLYPPPVTAEFEVDPKSSPESSPEPSPEASSKFGASIDNSGLITGAESGTIQLTADEGLQVLSMEEAEELAQQEIKKLKKCFAEADVDNSGDLDATELGAYMICVT